VNNPNAILFDFIIQVGTVFVSDVKGVLGVFDIDRDNVFVGAFYVT
jgi:hypothetical protein